MIALVALLALVVLACGACSSNSGRRGAGMLDGGGGNGGGDGGVITNPGPAVVYANSDAELYQIDPDTLAVTLIAPFGWPNGSDQMTDIAVDKDGNMVGISFTGVYAVDTKTAKCTFLATLDRMFNSLSFVPAMTVDQTDQEVLVAAALDGSFYRLDPKTGSSTPIGNYGGALGSSGDIVSVSGFGTIATVTTSSSGTDWLARVDASSGKATLIGDTKQTQIWGLGFWKDKVFGFTDGNDFVLIDPKTGASSLVQSGGVSWWGAAVTTAALVIM